MRGCRSDTRRIFHPDYGNTIGSAQLDLRGDVGFMSVPTIAGSIWDPGRAEGVLRVGVITLAIILNPQCAKCRLFGDRAAIEQLEGGKPTSVSRCLPSRTGKEKIVARYTKDVPILSIPPE